MNEELTLVERDFLQWLKDDPKRLQMDNKKLSELRGCTERRIYQLFEALEKAGKIKIQMTRIYERSIDFTE